MHRDCGEWRHGDGISSSALSRGATGAEVLFITGVGAGKFWGEKDFARKVFCATFAYKFSPTKTSFWCNRQKKVFM